MLDDALKNPYPMDCHLERSAKAEVFLSLELQSSQDQRNEYRHLLLHHSNKEMLLEFEVQSVYPCRFQYSHGVQRKIVPLHISRATIDRYL